GRVAAPPPGRGGAHRPVPLPRPEWPARHGAGRSGGRGPPRLRARARRIAPRGPGADPPGRQRRPQPRRRLLRRPAPAGRGPPGDGPPGGRGGPALGRGQRPRGPAPPRGRHRQPDALVLRRLPLRNHDRPRQRRACRAPRLPPGGDAGVAELRHLRRLRLDLLSPGRLHGRVDPLTSTCRDSGAHVTVTVPECLHALIVLKVTMTFASPWAGTFTGPEGTVVKTVSLGGTRVHARALVEW